MPGTSSTSTIGDLTITTKTVGVSLTDENNAKETHSGVAHDRLAAAKTIMGER